MLTINATSIRELCAFYKRKTYYDDGANLIGVKSGDFILWHRLQGGVFVVTGSTLTPEGARRCLLKKEAV